MARIAGKTTEQTILDMKRAATRLIALHGFEGMNLRLLAEEIGLKAGSLYNHIESKESLLHELLSDTMAELMAGLDAALAGADGPVDALGRFVTFHIEFHAVRRDEVFIGNAELRSLNPAHRSEIVAMRARYEKRLAAILRDGQTAGLFSPGDIRVASYALIAMLSGVCHWYRANGRLSVAQLVRQHRRLALGAVGATPVAIAAGQRGRR